MSDEVNTPNPSPPPARRVIDSGRQAALQSVSGHLVLGGPTGARATNCHRQLARHRCQVDGILKQYEDFMTFGRATLSYGHVAGDNRLTTVGYMTFIRLATSGERHAACTQ